MYDAGDFLERFSEFLDDEKDGALHRYYGYTGSSGALLLKELDSGTRVLFNPWLRDRPVGLKDLTRTRDRYRTFKKQTPSVQVHIASSFRPSVTRYVQQGRDLALVTFDPEELTADLVGSPNLSKTVLEAILEFAEAEGLSTTYDFVGTLHHKGYEAGVAQADAVKPSATNPLLFISYSWDSSEHREWVIQLAAKLIRSGINVLIDVWDLPDYGDDLHKFMESGIREADYVLLICTPAYARRANERQGGVGVESTIITGEFYDPQKATKFVPVVRSSSGDFLGSLPSYLKSRYAIDFSSDGQFGRSLEDLLRRLLKQPRYRRPDLGPLPRLPTKDV